jgi:hypothetical protein
MRRLSFATGLIVLTAGLLAPSQGYAQQTVNISIGGFVPNGYGSRTRDDTGLSEDVLRSDLYFLAFNLHDFHRFQINGEYLVGIGNFLEAGLGVGYDEQTVPSVYAGLVNSNGTEITQSLKLRTTPFTATVRLLPLGRTHLIEPYVGGGVAIVNWRYTESGQWVDTTDNSIFVDSFTGSGTSVGPMILGGLRVPLGIWGFGGEFRWQHVHGDLPTNQGFATTRDGQTPWIDLGGWSYLATFQIHF